MAVQQVVSLDTAVPRLEVPQSGDTYSMPRDVDHANNAVTGVKQLTISGDPASYTSQPSSYVYINANHTYDYSVGGFGVIIPPSVEFAGTHTLEQVGNAFGMGSLFLANATIKNVSGEANNLTAYYTVSSGNIFQADTQPISQSTQVDFLSSPTFKGINGGTLAVTSTDGYLVSGTISTGATVTSRRGFTVSTPTVTGTLTNQAGFSCMALTGATNNTQLLLGTSTIPSGNYNIYQSDATMNRWNGGQNWKETVSASTSFTATAAANHYYVLSSTSTTTVTLPNATTCGGSEFVIKKTGASGTTQFASVSSQTFDGAASPLAITTQWHILRVMSDGSNWLIMKTGAP